MPLDAIAVANALLDIARQEGATDVTPMKLQKLVYYAHGWNLAVTGQPLIDEQIEAWQYGPVVDSIYHAAKGYGNTPIAQRLVNQMGYPAELSAADKSVVTPLLNWIWQQYGQFSGVYLSNLTHMPNTPWYQVAHQEKLYFGYIPRGTDIPTNVIQEHFTRELEAQNNAVHQA